MEELYLNINQLCKYLGIKKKTIYDMVYRKCIPYCKVGHQLRFPKSLIDTWLKENTHIPFRMRICYNEPTVEGRESGK